MVTYTLEHHVGDTLSDMLAAILEAFRKYKSGRAWQEFIEDYEWVGSVRSLEVTHGANGWHPHIHELGLLKHAVTELDLTAIEKFAKKRWVACLKKMNKNASWKHGVKVMDDHKNLRDYVAKYGREPVALRWNIVAELTKSPAKKGRVEGRTPMQILADYGQGDKKSGKLFVEYSRAFKGRNQLVWSRGLRGVLGLGVEQSDELVLEREAQEGVVLATLTRDEWLIVLKANKRGEILEVASRGDVDQLNLYISGIMEVFGGDEEADNG